MDFSDGNWHHIVVTHDSSSKETKFWLDNVATESGTTVNGAIAASGTRQVSIGGSIDSRLQALYGYLDSFMVFDKVITAADVAGLYNSGNGRACGPAPSPYPTPTRTVSPTPSPTRTPSRTPTRTPSTSVPSTTINVYNDIGATASINTLRVDGTLVTGGSFPVAPGNNTTCTTYENGASVDVLCNLLNSPGSGEYLSVEGETTQCDEIGGSLVTVSGNDFSVGTTTNIFYSTDACG